MFCPITSRSDGKLDELQRHANRTGRAGGCKFRTALYPGTQGAAGDLHKAALSEVKALFTDAGMEERMRVVGKITGPGNGVSVV